MLSQPHARLGRLTTVETQPGQPRTRVLRVIARLNIGGPAYHVTMLSGRLDPERYDTLLVCGNLGPGEGSFEDLAGEYGANVRRISTLSPRINPVADLRAFLELRRIIRRFRPDIVHTHTAKAGMLGRSAAALARERPLIVHTFHGHVLRGYFGRAKTGLYRWFERRLATVSDRLIGVSDATVRELVGLRIAPASRFRTIPVGLDLDSLLELEGRDEVFLREIGAAASDTVVLYLGRVEQIKRLDVAIRAVAEGIESGAPLLLAIAGDGTLTQRARELARELGVEDRVRFLGFRRDLERLLAGSDIALLTSDNEGTPVFLIQAGAAGRPSVATDVGGVSDIVDDETGVLVPAGDFRAAAAELVRFSQSPELRERKGRAARRRVADRYSSDRLLRDVDSLYRELLAERHPAHARVTA